LLCVLSVLGTVYCAMSVLSRAVNITHQLSRYHNCRCKPLTFTITPTAYSSLTLTLSTSPACPSQCEMLSMIFSQRSVSCDIAVNGLEALRSGACCIIIMLRPSQCHLRCLFCTLSSLVFFYLVSSFTALSCLMSARDCICKIIFFLLSSHSEYIFFFFLFFFCAAIAICSILLTILCYFPSPSSLHSHISSSFSFSSSSSSSSSCPSSSSPSRPYTDHLLLYSLLSVTSKGVAFYHVILMSYSMPVMVRTVRRHCYSTYSLVVIVLLRSSSSIPLSLDLCLSGIASLLYF
jgi:hypothetical protein